MNQEPKSLVEPLVIICTNCF